MFQLSLRHLDYELIYIKFSLRLYISFSNTFEIAGNNEIERKFFAEFSFPP